MTRCPSLDPSLHPCVAERRCELDAGHDGIHRRTACDVKRTGRAFIVKRTGRRLPEEYPYLARTAMTWCDT